MIRHLSQAIARALARPARWWSAAGVASAVVLAVAFNILAVRFYARWDWTTERLYTLSPATEETLHSLSEPVDVVVFLSQGDPLTLTVRHMLEAYGAETRMLAPRYVDPDKNPAEFLALQQQYDIRVEGKTEDGRLVTDAAVVVARGSRRWFLTSADFFAYDNEGRAKSKLEQALTAAIRNVLGKERTTVCFSTGHGEISSDDGGPQGLAELRFRLQKNNYEAKVVDLSAEKRGEPLTECELLIVGAPEQAFEPRAAQSIAAWFRGGGSLLLATNPLLDDESRITKSGLETVFAAAGIELGRDFVIEPDPEMRLPLGEGETFFATPVLHDITRGLVDDDEVKMRVVLTTAQSMRSAEGAKVVPKSLLRSSETAFSFRDIRPFVNDGRDVKRGENDSKGPFALAMAAEIEKTAGRERGPRFVAIGSANVLFGRTWRDAGLVGTRVFLESAVAWLTSRPAIVDVPEKGAQVVGLSLTEDSLSELRRYVLVFMPGAALLLGMLVMYRRRSVERASRRGKDE